MKRNAGFTITELMIAVVIIGVLATLAIPGFTSYIYKARVTEATNFLGKIKQRQESYRNEFGQYCNVSTDLDDTIPAAAPGIDPIGWDPTDEWNQLGAAPDGPVRFRYATIAGFPGTPGPGDAIEINDDDHWFIARAIGDLDEDATTFNLEVSSQSDRVYNGAAATGGWE
jgi:prepilin-type N-terminal cleavage/methylation domain-containing protein